MGPQVSQSEATWDLITKCPPSISTPVSSKISLSQHHLTLPHCNLEVCVSGEGARWRSQASSRIVTGKLGSWQALRGPGAPRRKPARPPRPAPAPPRLPPAAFRSGDHGLTLKRTGMSPGAGAPATPTVNGTKSPEGAGRQQSVP